MKTLQTNESGATDVVVSDGSTPNANGQIVTDANPSGAYFRRQLVQFEEDEETLFSPNISASIIPRDGDGGWKRDFTYAIKNTHGKADIVECCDDIPIVGLTRCEQSSKALTIAAGAKWCWTDVEYAREAGENLEADFAQVAQRAIDEKLEELIWSGETQMGVTGILNNPALNRINFTGIGETSNDLYKKLAIVRNTVITNLNGAARRPDTWLVPPSLSALLDTSFIGVNDQLLRDRISAQFNLNIVEIPYLEFAGRDGKPISMMMVNDRAYMRTRIPIDLTAMAPHFDGSHYCMMWFLRFAGVRTSYTDSVIILEGLQSDSACPLTYASNCISQMDCAIGGNP